MQPSKRDQAIECMDEIESGMIRVGMTRDIWQNELIWQLCRAVKLLLEQYIRGKHGQEKEN